MALRSVGLGLAVGLLAGCKQEPPGQYTVDTRIDGASDNNDPDSVGTRMCAAADGTIYVAWLDDRNHGATHQHDLWMNRSLQLGKPGTWLPSPIRVNVGDPSVDSDIWSPTLYCNNTGVYAFWEDDRDGTLHNHNIYFNRSNDHGETFLSADVPLDDDDDGFGNSIGPVVTGVVPTGGVGSQRLSVAWYDNTFGSYDIMVSSSADGGDTWGAPNRVDSDQPPGGFWSASPQIAMTVDTKDIYVTWEDRRNGATDIYFGHSGNGGSQFDVDQRIDTATDGSNDPGLYESSHPRACTDGLDHVYVVWEDLRNSEQGDTHDIYYNYSADRGVTWLPDAQRLETDNPGFGDSINPTCVADGVTAHVTWSDEFNGSKGYDIYYRDIVAGVATGDVQRLDVGVDGKEPDGFANSLDPLIAMGTDGRIAVAWSDQRGEADSPDPQGNVDLYYNYAPSGGSFQTSNDLRIDSWLPGASAKTDLNLAILGGSLYTAWADTRTLSSDIYFTTLKLGEQSDPPPREELEAAAAQ